MNLRQPVYTRDIDAALDRLRAKINMGVERHDYYGGITIGHPAEYPGGYWGISGLSKKEAYACLHFALDMLNAMETLNGED